MMPPALLNDKVTIKRRASTGTDSLGNPIYGAPTDGSGWSTVYKNVPVKLAFSSKVVRFAQEGERINPTGVMYYNKGYDLKAEDRVLTADSIEYTVISIVPAKTFGAIIDHYEAILQLP